MEKLLLCCTILLQLLSVEVLADAKLPKSPYCGQSSLSSLKGRIFEGSKTSIDEYPWLVHLQSQVILLGKIPMGGGVCTSSLINSNWVLTAAHCIFDPYSLQYPKLFRQFAQVTLGEWNTQANPDCDENHECAPRSIKLAVISADIHPGYIREKENGVHYDIALLKLERSVKYSTYIQPICLPVEPIDDYEGLKVIIAGWGRYGNKLNSSSIKRKSIVTIKDMEPCDEWYGENMELNDETQLCVGGLDGSACQGDSGGPLLLEPKRNRNAYYQIGVASLGRQECTKLSRPAVYVRVDYFMNWIRQTIKRRNYETSIFGEFAFD